MRKVHRKGLIEFALFKITPAFKEYEQLSLPRNIENDLTTNRRNTVHQFILIFFNPFFFFLSLTLNSCNFLRKLENLITRIRFR